MESTKTFVSRITISPNVVISWGDAIFPGLPEFDPAKLTAKSQTQRFGYNNDFIAYMPLPRGSQNSERGCYVSTMSTRSRT